MSDNVVKPTPKRETTIAAIKAKVEAAHAANREPTGREQLARLRETTVERKERERGREAVRWQQHCYRRPFP